MYHLERRDGVRVGERKGWWIDYSLLTTHAMHPPNPADPKLTRTGGRRLDFFLVSEVMIGWFFWEIVRDGLKIRLFCDLFVEK